MQNKVLAYLAFVVVFWSLAVAPAVLSEAADGSFISISVLCAVLPISPVIAVFWGRLFYAVPIGLMVGFAAMSMNGYVESTFVDKEAVTSTFAGSFSYVWYLLVLYSVLAYAVKRIFRVDLIRYPEEDKS